MNATAKRKYLNDLLQLISFEWSPQVGTRATFVRRAPEVLYKYRRFDKYSFEMIDESYAFLPEVDNLDDPFDCLCRNNTGEYFDVGKRALTKRGLAYVVSKAAAGKNIGDMPKAEVLKTLYGALNEDGSIDDEKLREYATWHNSMTPPPRETFFIMMRNFNENFSGILSEVRLDGFENNALASGKKVGVLSLSAKRDNKPMWSLYGDQYSGYCIEYEVPRDWAFISNLCPVIYSKNANNCFIERLLEYAIGAFDWSITGGSSSTGLTAAMELFCTKDGDWAYQDEWRLIGGANRKYKGLKIKAIYLGFKVKPKNECKMLNAAKKHGFKLFKMRRPEDGMRIKYIQLQ